MVDHQHHVPPNPIDWSMVVIHHDKNDNFVFPPINHENLQIPSDSDHTTPHYSPSPPSSSSPSSSSSSSSVWSDSDTCGPSSSPSPFNSQLRKGGDFTGWLSMGLQILRSKLSSFRNRAAEKGAFWSFGMPLAALVASCWVIFTIRRKKSKRRSLTPNEARLINIINDKDKRIAQLLHQIAQMNGILIDRHKALAAKSG